MQIVNPRSRVLKLISDWTEVSSKKNLKSQLFDKAKRSGNKKFLPSSSMML